MSSNLFFSHHSPPLTSPTPPPPPSPTSPPPPSGQPQHYRPPPPQRRRWQHPRPQTGRWRQRVRQKGVNLNRATLKILEITFVWIANFRNPFKVVCSYLFRFFARVSIYFTICPSEWAKSLRRNSSFQASFPNFRLGLHRRWDPSHRGIRFRAPKALPLLNELDQLERQRRGGGAEEKGQVCT